MFCHNYFIVCFSYVGNGVWHMLVYLLWCYLFSLFFNVFVLFLSEKAFWAWYSMYIWCDIFLAHLSWRLNYILMIEICLYLSFGSCKQTFHMLSSPKPLGQFQPKFAYFGEGVSNEGLFSMGDKCEIAKVL